MLDFYRGERGGSWVPHGNPSRLAKKHDTHLDTFDSLIRYLVKLRRDGVLDDKGFNDLVKLAAAIFVESEISQKIEEIVYDRLVNPLTLGGRR
jgi:hypothetical protein